MAGEDTSLRPLRLRHGQALVIPAAFMPGTLEFVYKVAPLGFRRSAEGV